MTLTTDSKAHPVMGALLEPAHLTHALRVVIGTSSRRADWPDTAAVASALGVSIRQVQRWLNGTATPGPGPTHELARLLRPTEETRNREQSDARYADKAAKAMALPRGRGIRPEWRASGWHHQHSVYELHHPHLEVARAAVVGPGPKALEAALTLKPRPLNGHWRIRKTIEVPNYFEAVLARTQLLQQHDALRVTLPRELMRRANTLCWLAGDGEPER